MTDVTDENPSLLEFPCEFPIKMMGRDNGDFQTTARRLVEQHTGPISNESIRVSPSREGRFISVTVTINAESQAQLDAIYIDLSAHDAVLVAL